MILTRPSQSLFKKYYLLNYERITNRNFKKIRSGFVSTFLEDMIWINSVYICGCDANKLYDLNENKKLKKGELLSLLHDTEIKESEFLY